MGGSNYDIYCDCNLSNPRMGEKSAHNKKKKRSIQFNKKLKIDRKPEQVERVGLIDDQSIISCRFRICGRVISTFLFLIRNFEFESI